MKNARPFLRAPIAIFFLGFCFSVSASPYLAAGDLVARHDVQLLADHGLINSVTTTWPLSWGPIIEDLQKLDVSSLSPQLVDSIDRLLYRARIETQTNVLGYKVSVGAAENPTEIRSFQRTPRGNLEVSAGAEWLGERISMDLNVQAVDSGEDSQNLRADGSMLGVMVGNWSLAASTQERWWGPGWDGSIILSNNARPIPSLTIDRVFTDAFKSKWLSWIGPWDMNITVGQLESDREVPDARFFGMRINFRPLRNLEVGLTRSAQWCGRGRPCDARTFYKLLIGQDNRGGEGVAVDNEPGNQLAGVDFRWSPQLFRHRIALYGQFIGEDEAGGFPSRFLGQLGGEWSGYLGGRWSTRVFGEFAGTTCQFHESSEEFNCAYNHSIYVSGYRFRNRSIGHSADNDARVISLGISLVDSSRTEWRALLRYAKLNRGGVEDIRNTLTSVPLDVSSIDIGHTRYLPIGKVNVGIGYQHRESNATQLSDSNGRLFFEWMHFF